MIPYLVLENKLRKYLKINNLESVGLYDVMRVVNPNKKTSEDSEIDVYCSNFSSLSEEYPNLPINQLYGVGIGVDEKYQDNLYFLIKEKPKERVYKGAKRYYGDPNITNKEFIYIQDVYSGVDYYLQSYEHDSKFHRHNFTNIINEYEKYIQLYAVYYTQDNTIQELDLLIEKCLQQIIVI